MIHLVDDFYLKADNIGLVLFRQTAPAEAQKKARFEVSGMYTDVRALAKDFGRKMQVASLQDDRLTDLKEAAERLNEVCERLEGFIGEKAKIYQSEKHSPFSADS